MSSAFHLGDCEAAVAWEPSGRAAMRLVPPPRRRPRAPRRRLARSPRSSALNGSPQVRTSSHRARAPPSRCPLRQTPCRRSAAQLGEVGFQAFPSPARNTSCHSLHLKPARHASACSLLFASDACPRRAASRASRPAAPRTPARRPERAELGDLSAAPASLTAVPWLPRSRSCEAHSVPRSFLACRCLSPRGMVSRASAGRPRRGRADDAGSGAAGGVGSSDVEQQQEGLAELPRLYV